MKRVFAVLLLAASCWAGDIRQSISAAVVAVNNSTATTIKCGLAKTTTIQLYIRPNSTAQIFTLTLPDTTTIEVASGSTFTIRMATPLDNGDTIGTVITGTGSANLQVISMREYK